MVFLLVAEYIAAKTSEHETAEISLFLQLCPRFAPPLFVGDLPSHAAPVQHDAQNSTAAIRVVLSLDSANPSSQGLESVLSSVETVLLPLL